MLLIFYSFAYFLSLTNGLRNEEMTNLIPDNYKRIRPPNSEPTIVYWCIVPHLISDLDLKHMEFSADLTIYASWDDDQLNVNVSDLVNLPSETAKKLWYPPMEFQNCKSCNEAINSETNTFYLTEKTIVVEYRKSIKFICIFDFSHYPFDKQYCNIDMQLYDYNGPVNISFCPTDYYKGLLVPPEYKLVSTERMLKPCGNSSLNYKVICFSYMLVFKRIPTQHLMLLFIPSILIVMLSWISFWLKVELAAPRVALGLTSLLTLATQFSSAQKDLPSVATFKALDIWMVVCIFMVFSSLVVFALANSSKQLKTLKATNLIYYTSRNQPRKLALNLPGNVTYRRIKRKILKRINIKNINIDRNAKKIFPLFFLIFNIAFWTIYT